MAKRAKVKMNNAEVVALLSGAPIQAVLNEQADEILGRCPPIGYEATYGRPGKTRTRAFVGTGNQASRIDNAKNATLLRAIAGKDMVVYTRKDGSKRIATKKQAENWSRG